MKESELDMQVDYFFLSKYTFRSLSHFPRIRILNFNIILYYKQKYKHFLFLHILILLFFFNVNILTRFYLKVFPVNILQIKLRNSISLYRFLNNFFYVYFPLIDSFSTEFKVFFSQDIIKFNFFKFPLVYELNLFFLSMEYLYLFLNNYKFQLEFYLRKKRKTAVNLSLLQYYKFPLFLL